MNAKDEINKAIGVLKARIDCVIEYDDSQDFVQEYDALCRAIYSLEKWRDSDTLRYIPEIARQKIWFGQQAQLCCKENGYAIVDFTIT